MIGPAIELIEKRPDSTYPDSEPAYYVCRRVVAPPSNPLHPGRRWLSRLEQDFNAHRIKHFAYPDQPPHVKYGSGIISAIDRDDARSQIELSCMVASGLAVAPTIEVPRYAVTVNSYTSRCFSYQLRLDQIAHEVADLTDIFPGFYPAEVASLPMARVENQDDEAASQLITEIMQKNSIGGLMLGPVEVTYWL